MTREQLLEGLCKAMQKPSDIGGWEGAAHNVLDYISPMMQEVAKSQRAAIKFLLATHEGDAALDVCEKLSDSLAHLECFVKGGGE